MYRKYGLPIRFQDLPLEVCVSIFHHLPALDVVRLEQVSTEFRKLVRESVTLQYKIECFLCGVVDQTPGTHTVADKRRSLKFWHQRWKRPGFTEVCEFSGYLGKGYVSGPIFAQACRDSIDEQCSSIEFYAFDAPLRGVRDRDWVLSNLNVNYNFAIDWYQDLLVVVESSEDSRDFIVRFLTCTTGSVHPAAEQETFQLMLPVESTSQDFKLQICGDLLMLQYEYFGRMFIEMWAIDWRKGRLLLQLGEDHDVDDVVTVPVDCALIDSRYVLVALTGDSQTPALVGLDCYQMPAGVSRLVLEGIMQNALFVLELPRVLPGHFSDDLRLSVACNPHSPHALPSQMDDSTVFRAAGAPVVLVGLECGETPPNRLRYDLLIPGRFILSQLHRASAPGAHRLAWQAYSRECRIVNTGYRSCAGVVHGARYATSCKVWVPNGGAFVDVLEISHFLEPAAIYRDTDVEDGQSDDPGLQPAVCCVVKPSDQSNDEVWAEPMHTGAPYLATWTDLVLEDADELFLLEDGVVVSERDTSEHMHAYTF
ncbi:F-box protein [Phanerochaete sordida]|uniref:F-box protein n=1 Tax=Phanerochaete sordida TaxID=48140 RepID=A0A9P3GRJ9_9APHY|nr:F-box protein [Phanerochaete sordida]